MPSANKKIDKNLVIIDHTPYTLDEFAGLPLFCLTANDWFTYVTGGDFHSQGSTKKAGGRLEYKAQPNFYKWRSNHRGTRAST